MEKKKNEKDEKKRKIRPINIFLPIITPIVALAIALPLTLVKCSGDSPVATEHTVTYEDCYDSAAPVITTEKVKTGEKAQMPYPEHHSGAGFIGWKTVKDNDSAPYFDFMNTPITSDIKLYGYWKRTVDTDAFEAVYKEGVYGPFLRCKIDYCHQHNIVDLVVPDTIDGKPVIGVYEECFRDDDPIFQSISLPDSIEVFDWWAFSGCYTLRIINMPRSLKRIGAYAFSYCAKIANYNFYEGLEIIEDYAFNGGNIGSDASFIKTLSLPSTLKYIGIAAFAYDSLQKLDLSKCTNLVLAPNAFAQAINLIEITLPTNLPYIPTGCFNQCTRLRYINIPKTVKYIDNGAFTECYRIREVTVEDGSELISIGSDVFNFCSSLEKINFPKSLKSIGYRAFYNCPNLNSVSFGNTNNWYYTIDGKQKIITPSATDTTANAKKIKEWARNENANLTVKTIKKDGINYLTDDEGKCVVAGCDEGTTGVIDIPATITDDSIDDSHVYKVVGIMSYALQNATISGINFKPDSTTNEIYLEYISDYAFLSCKTLASINLGDCTNLNFIGNSAFEHAFCNTTNASIDFDLSKTALTYIGDLAFANTDIGEGQNVGTINTVKLPATIEYLGNGAFYNQMNLTELNFAVDAETGKSNLASIGSYADSEALCTPLINSKKQIDKIDLSKTQLTYLPRSIFEGNTGLKKVTLPSTIIAIYEYAFKGCSSLTTINIPNDCYYIRYNAFADCEALNSATFEDTTLNTWNVYHGTRGDTFTTSTADANATALKETFVDYTWYKQLI